MYVTEVAVLLALELTLGELRQLLQDISKHPFLVDPMPTFEAISMLLLVNLGVLSRHFCGT